MDSECCHTCVSLVIERQEGCQQMLGVEGRRYECHDPFLVQAMHCTRTQAVKVVDMLAHKKKNGTCMHRDFTVCQLRVNARKAWGMEWNYRPDYALLLKRNGVCHGELRMFRRLRWGGGDGGDVGQVWLPK